MTSHDFDHRHKRIAEMLAMSKKEVYGSVREITGVDYVDEVNKAGDGVWVVLHLYQSRYPHLLSVCVRACVCVCLRACVCVCTKSSPPICKTGTWSSTGEQSTLAVSHCPLMVVVGHRVPTPAVEGIDGTSCEFLARAPGVLIAPAHRTCLVHSCLGLSRNA